jgi:predicted lipoprotein with Yx(FWY)xxD motif
VPSRLRRSTDRRSLGVWRLLRFAGAAALIATGAIHLDLYLTGYSTIPTIGWLFLLQVISAFVLAIVILIVPLRLASVAGAGLLLSTLVGYLISLHVSLFGFREVRTTAGIVAAVIEIVGFTALAGFAVRPERSGGSPAFGQRTTAKQRVWFLIGRWAAGVIAVGAAVSFVALLPNAAATATGSGGSSVIIKVAHIHGTSVLTNKHGYTLYWFAPDSATSSHCYSTCAAYWPPVIGTASPSTAVPGAFGALKRTSGAEQVTYNGHPLYTYVGDSAPGQATGNRIRLNGGWWYEMKASG